MSDSTTNLGFTLIDGSDYVSPSPINENFKIVDRLGLDYVIASGYSGEWWFRKWKSGRAECGIDAKQFAKSEVHVWGGADSGLYATNGYSFGAYPFAFSTRPHVNVSFQHDSSRTGRGSLCILFNNDSATTQSPNFEVVDSWNEALQPICSIYVCGRTN